MKIIPANIIPVNVLRLALFALVPLTLSACGFTPLYEDVAQSGTSSSAKMPQIALTKVDATNELTYLTQDALKNTFVIVDGQYTLELTLKEVIQNIGVTRSAQSVRYNLLLTGQYRLKDAAGKLIEKGDIETYSSYNAVPSQYATFTGKEDARRKAVADLSRKLETEMALFLKRQ